MGKLFVAKERDSDKYLVKGGALCGLSLGFFIWLWIWSIFAKKSIAQEVGGIESLISNWKADFITDIEFSSTGTCSQGFELAFNGTWGGTVTGCDCLGIFCHRRGVRDNQLGRGGCNTNETLCGCDGVSSRPRTKLEKVPSQDYICVKRAKDLNFLNLYSKMDNTGTCTDGHKKCGDINGKSKGVCIPNSETCPITDVIFSTGANPDAGKYDLSKTGTGINVYYTRADIQQPWVDTVFKEDHVCYDPNAVPISSGRSGYKLLSDKPFKDCKKDTRFVKQQAMTYGRKDVFDQNNVPYAGLPAFTLNNEFFFHKFTRSLITWSPTCISLVDSIIEQEKTVQKLEGNVGTMKTLALVSWILCIFLGCVEFFSLASKNNEYTWGYCLSFPVKIIMYIL